MSEPASAFVRPTKRCLDDLGLKFPTLEVGLHTLDDPVVRKAQSVPEEVACGGADRVLSLSDRVWYKVKTGTRRAIVTRLDPTQHADDPISASESWWWLCAAGERKADSATDFYKVVEARATRAASGAKAKVDTAGLLPAVVDVKRIQAELALRTALGVRRMVRGLIARSLRDGKTWTATATGHQVTAKIRAEDGEAYLVICAEGFLDARMIGVILNSVPGVPSDDWLPEPGGVLNIQPRDGQIVYSTMIPPSAQAEILEEFPSDSN